MARKTTLCSEGGFHSVIIWLIHSYALSCCCNPASWVLGFQHILPDQEARITKKFNLSIDAMVPGQPFAQPSHAVVLEITCSISSNHHLVETLGSGGATGIDKSYRVAVSFLGLASRGPRLRRVERVGVLQFVGKARYGLDRHQEIRAGQSDRLNTRIARVNQPSLVNKATLEIRGSFLKNDQAIVDHEAVGRQDIPVKGSHRTVVGYRSIEG